MDETGSIEVIPRQPKAAGVWLPQVKKERKRLVKTPPSSCVMRCQENAIHSWILVPASRPNTTPRHPTPQQFFPCNAQPKPNVWRWGRKGSAVVAWTVVGLEVTVVVRDLQAARTTLPEFLEAIRREYGPLVAVGVGMGGEAGGGALQSRGQGAVKNGTEEAGGLRHRAPSQGAGVEMGAAVVGSSTVS